MIYDKGRRGGIVVFNGDGWGSWMEKENLILWYVVCLFGLI